MIRINRGLRYVCCDARNCGGVRAVLPTNGKSAAEARAAAHTKGWRHGTAQGIDRTIDTCPECTPKAMENAE